MTATAFTTAGLQASGIDRFSLMDHNSLYHFGMMVMVIFFYFAGRRLKTGE